MWIHAQEWPVLLILLMAWLSPPVTGTRDDIIKITNFSPRTGPISGGTNVTIEGLRLNTIYTSETADLTIKMNIYKQILRSWNDSHIVFETTPVGIEYERYIRLVYKPKDPMVKKPNPVQSYRKFRILKPVLLGFEPKLTHDSRGREINVLISGQHLNVGNKQQISLWSGDCTIVTNDGTKLVCKLMDFTDPLQLDDVSRNTIHMKIDNWSASLLSKVDSFFDVYGNQTVISDGSAASHKSSGSSNNKTVIIGAIVLLTLTPAVIAVTYLLMRVKREQEKQSLSPMLQLKRRLISPVATAIGSAGIGVGEEKAGLVPMIDESDMASLFDLNKIIAIEHLTLMAEIGQGNFSQVFRGRLQVNKLNGALDVAVKTIGDRLKDGSQIHAFFKEALVMKDFEHANIMSLIGVAFAEDGLPLLIMPLMAEGDLLSFLRNDRLMPRKKDLIRMGVDIATGMAYLEANRVVHRDLAARNCLLDADLNVRVSDFGLSRDVYSRGYYHSSQGSEAQLPYRWMAPESIDFKQYTSQSDVWSFGVLLWELMTRGSIPFASVSSWEIVTVLKCGKRLDRPDSCPEFLYQIMSSCWAYDPEQRPTFANLVKEIPQRREQCARQSDAGSRHSLSTATTTTETAVMTRSASAEAEYENCPQ